MRFAGGTGAAKPGQDGRRAHRPSAGFPGVGDDRRHGYGFGASLRELVYLLLLSAAWIVPAPAGVGYLPEKNIVWVTDFPAARPCTLRDVWRADQLYGWKLVDFDETGRVCEIRAHLWIGAPAGLDTVFQIGDAGRPDLELVMHGDLRVCPDMPPTPPDKIYQTFVKKTTPGVNRLIIGDPTNAAVRPVIRFANKQGLYLASGTGQRHPHAGELFMYNAVITALYPEKGERVGGMLLLGRTLRLFDSRLEWLRNGVNGVFGGGWDHVVAGMTFTNCAYGIRGFFDSRAFAHPLKGCRFIDCGTALDRMHGYVLLEDCAFTDNHCDWDLNNRDLKQLILRNCITRNTQTGASREIADEVIEPQAPSGDAGK